MIDLDLTMGLSELASLVKPSFVQSVSCQRHTAAHATQDG